jgi:hypothetical protein
MEGVLLDADHPRSGVLLPANERKHEGVLRIEWQPQKKGSAFVSLPMDEILKNELRNHDARDT